MLLRGAIGIAAVLSVAAALSACESAPEDSGSDAPDEVPAVSAAPELPAGPDTAAVDDTVPPGQVIETGAAGPGLAILPPEPPEPVIDDDPQQLYGLDSRALGDLLGEPSLIRVEAPARIWQYRSQTCVFDVFLYDQAGESRVSFIEARDGAAERIDARACLNEILRARMGLPLG